MHPEFNRMEQVVTVLWHGDAHTLAACGRRAYVQDSAGRVCPSSPAPTCSRHRRSRTPQPVTMARKRETILPKLSSGTVPPEYPHDIEPPYSPSWPFCPQRGLKEYLKSSKVFQWHKAIHGAIAQICDRLLNSSNFSRLEAGQISGHLLHQFLGSKARPAFDQSIKTRKRMQGSQNEDPDLNFLKNGECVSPDSNLRDEQQFIT
ncbi:hypothetical protein B0H17DRAFT_1133780 [Mycena rosella]|uniref:Uncharacterized protein n=1 Tax=Mycena rosella TaxID=1033263 RepID=A0AAD7DJ75_MYCRO|nr:hypothetical protein B0H17DRAFT_1133780 [Mycena rosella]